MNKKSIKFMSNYFICLLSVLFLCCQHIKAKVTKPGQKKISRSQLIEEIGQKQFELMKLNNQIQKEQVKQDKECLKRGEEILEQKKDSFITDASFEILKDYNEFLEKVLQENKLYLQKIKENNNKIKKILLNKKSIDGKKTEK